MSPARTVPTSPFLSWPAARNSASKAAQPGSEAALPESVVKMIDQAVACCTTGDPRAFRAALVAAHTKAQVEQANGPNGRY